MDIELTEEQGLVLDTMEDWCLNNESMTDLTLGGFAGTGKTTILRQLIDRVGDRRDLQFVAPTGKAAQVLSRKGVPAHTVHSVFYNFTGHSEDESGRQTPQFRKREKVNLRPEIFICDESSMVNLQMARDIWRHRVPILWVGDHGQLPPIGEDPEILKSPDLKLETIHRQAAGNPVLQAAHSVRKGDAPANWLSGAKQRHKKGEDGGEIHVFRRGGDSGSIHEYALENEIDQIICGYNKTRISTNKLVRQELGRSGRFPVKGDRLICLKNNRSVGVFNGEIMDVEEVVEFIGNKKNPETCIVVIRLKSETGRDVTLPCWGGQFHSRDQLTTAEEEELIELYESQLSAYQDDLRIDSFDYGYAITCHKSQGSEWDRVMVVDQAFGEKSRWRYTALTRAKDFCAVSV